MKPKTITYRTRDEPPRLGDWIRSVRRPRYAYFIVGIRRVGPVRIGGIVGLDPAIAYKLMVERRPADAPGSDDQVHPIMWDSRARRRTP